MYAIIHTRWDNQFTRHEIHSNSNRGDDNKRIIQKKKEERNFIHVVEKFNYKQFQGP